MGRRGLASFIFALVLTLPLAGWAQESSTTNACADLGELSGLYRTADKATEARWAFNTAGDTARPGDPFLTEHTVVSEIERLGPGPHYVLWGAIDPDCASVSGKWRALFPADGERLMTGNFSASLVPGTITIAQADDDADNPHGWTGISLAFVDEPDPPMQLVFAQPLEHHGMAGKSITIAIADQLAFQGLVSAAQTLSLADALEFHTRVLSTTTVDFDSTLAFSGTGVNSTGEPQFIALAQTLAFTGNTNQRRMIDLADALAFRGKPFGLRVIELAEPLRFEGKQYAARTVTPGDALSFHGDRPVVHTLTISDPLEFHRRHERTRRVTLAPLAFYGKIPAETRMVSLAGPLLFEGRKPLPARNIALSARLVFPGDTALARAALTAATPDPSGAGPCGAVLDDSLKRADFSEAVPQSPDDINVETIEKLRAAYAPYQKTATAVLDAQADCMQKRLESFQALTALSPHDYWASNPAFNGATFYTSQIDAVRNAANYLRQIDWELGGIEAALNHQEDFYIFDSVDDPQAMKFGLVTDGKDAPEFRDANSMRMRDFELLKKHAESDAEAMTIQRNRYFRRKIAQRFRYLDALMPRTVDGLADWTKVENHVTRTFLPRVANAITSKVNELREVHDQSQPPTAAFVLPRGEFDNYFKEFSRLTQTGGPKIGTNSFRDFMNNKVWYDDYDTWPDATALSP